MRLWKKLILILIVGFLIHTGYYLYTERPWLSPCEQLREQCAQGRAEGDLRISGFCSMANMVGWDKATDEDCAKCVDGINRYRKGK